MEPVLESTPPTGTSSMPGKPSGRKQGKRTSAGPQAGARTGRAGSGRRCTRPPFICARNGPF